MDKDIIADLTEKHILHWNYREYVALPKELKENGNAVRELYLRQNRISELPNWINSLSNLTNLYLAGNNIEYLPEEISMLNNLVHLELRQNKIKSLPNCIGSLKCLNYLILSFNQIETVPTAIGDLKALYVLHLDNNNLRQLPKSICGCSSLQELCVHNNQLTSLPQSIVYLRNLDMLTLHSNRLLYLPAVHFGHAITVTVYCNPNLNYYIYPSSNINFSIPFTMCNARCTTCQLQDISDHPNKVIYLLSQPHRTHLVMPLGLKQIHSNNTVISLSEFTLRVVYDIYKYPALLKNEKPHEAAELLKYFPVNLRETICDGPLAICPICKGPIFTELLLCVLDENCELAAPRGNCYYSCAFLCSHVCENIFKNSIKQEGMLSEPKLIPHAQVH